MKYKYKHRIPDNRDNKTLKSKSITEDISVLTDDKVFDDFLQQVRSHNSIIFKDSDE